MRRQVIVVLFIGVVPALGQTHLDLSIQQGGGICRVSRNGIAPTLPQDLSFDPGTGELDLQTSGNWVISYQIGSSDATPINFNRVSASSSMTGTGLTVSLTGGTVLGGTAPGPAGDSFIQTPSVTGTKLVTLNIAGVAGFTQINTDGDIQGLISGSTVGQVTARFVPSGATLEITGDVERVVLNRLDGELIIRGDVYNEILIQNGVGDLLQVVTASFARFHRPAGRA